MQIDEKLLPVYINTNKSLLKLTPAESPYQRNVSIAVGRNVTGTQGGNFGAIKKIQSNWDLVKLDLPDGINKTIGFYEHGTLNEAYLFNWNSLGKHTIFILYGHTLTSEIVFQGPQLEFSIDPKNFISEHRVYVRVIYDIYNDEQRHVREKIIFFTDGNGWPRWIGVLSSMATKSYNADLFPYYTLKAPHFDANEFVDFAVRPPMFCPVMTAIERTDADKGLQNHMLNQSIQLATSFINTDGRASVLSPYSNPFFLKKSPCSNSKLLPRSVDVAIYAGSAHVEKIKLYVRKCGGDWMLYDTIDKYDSEGDNSPGVIGDQYWLRTNPWKKFVYDSETNILHYTYAGDREVTPVAKEDTDDFFNDVPIRSISMNAADDTLMFSNNLRDYNNLPTETLKQFEFNVGDAGAGKTACKIKNSKITLYAFIGGDSYLNNVVYTSGDKVSRFGGIRRTSVFGTSPYKIVWDDKDSDTFGLNMGLNANFVCYLAGTPYSAVATQYKVTAEGVMTKVDILDKNNNESQVLIQNTFAARGYFVQKFEFYVPAGKYIARLARHDVSLGTDYQKTSTYVQGLRSHKEIFTPSGDFYHNPVSNFSKEFQVDASAGDVDLWGKGDDMFYILAPIVVLGQLGFSHLVEGNVLEDSLSKIPIELVHYTMEHASSGTKRDGTFTDHNGFYFAYGSGGDVVKSEVIFDGFFKCSSRFLFRTNIGKYETLLGHFIGQEVTIKDNFDEQSAINNRIIFTGRVVNCDTDIGIASIGVTMTHGPTVYTDSNGQFIYLMRENASGTRNGDFLYFNSGGECLFTSCSCGVLDIIPISLAEIPCTMTAPRIGQSDILVRLKVVEQNGKGLKGGGRYGISGFFGDLAGRGLFLQDLGYLDIPTFMETGVFTPSAISWKLKGKLNLPSFVKYFTFFRTSNLSAKTYLQWVGDKIDFIDSKGNIVIDGHGAIRAKITIKSLLDFNIQSNFNTNVNYQFVQGDFLRVMDDGDSNLFAPADHEGFLDYQILGTNYNQTIAAEQSNQATITNSVQTAPGGAVTTTVSSTITNPVNVNDDGVSFIVDFDERLLALKDKTGFWIEVIRPRDLQFIEDYCEIAGTIPVIDGELAVSEGTLDTFDTYFQIRSIKIPNALGKSLGHPFESSSVTDFSGANCSSCGRRNVKDPEARQTWHEDESAKSDEIINEGRVNGLGRCRTKNRKNFKGQNFGGIVAVHAERNRLIFVCERDWYVTDFDQSFVKVTSQGLLNVPLDQGLSDPYPKEGSNYGCAYEDTATIVFWDGTSIWADRYNSAIVALDYHHNQSAVPVGYRNAVNIAAEDVQSYFINKFNYMSAHNAALLPADYLNNLVELIAGINPQTGEYNLTFRPRMGLSTEPQHFVNNEREIFYDMAETFVYNPDFKKWVSFAGYAPEFYGKLYNSISGIELISFAAGQPWFHNTIGKKGSMCFYGVQSDQVIEVALNAGDDVKLFQNIWVNSPDTKYFIDRVLTENPNFFSYIPLAHFKREDRVWYACFKNNMGAYPNPLKRVPSLLIDGTSPVSKVALVRLVANPANSADYGELNEIEYRIIANGRTKEKQ